MTITLLHLQIKSFTLFPPPTTHPPLAHHHPSAFVRLCSGESFLFSEMMAMKKELDRAGVQDDGRKIERV